MTFQSLLMLTLPSSSKPVDWTSPNCALTKKPGTGTETFCLVIWKTEAVNRPSTKVGSYLTPASY
ncbi:hypothetical protein D3C87_1658310 [compost metagenome]